MLGSSITNSITAFFTDEWSSWVVRGFSGKEIVAVNDVHWPSALTVRNLCLSRWIWECPRWQWRLFACLLSTPPPPNGAPRRTSSRKKDREITWFCRRYKVMWSTIRVQIQKMWQWPWNGVDYWVVVAHKVPPLVRTLCCVHRKKREADWYGSGLKTMKYILRAQQQCQRFYCLQW